jgi:predicted MFS family arabinose efflux permease
MSSPPSERRLLFLLGATQFVNVLDFMMVMPLGPDFSAGLDIPMSHLGLIAGAYTGAASIAGLAGAFFLDRFDRRRALVVALTGLAIATFAGAFAQGLGTMILARVLAGACGGPATALTYSIIADAVAPERRGRALGAVMSAFTIASAIGVPAGLRLALVGGWRAPFVAVGLLIAVVGGFAARSLPPMRDHLDRPEARRVDLGFLLRGLPRFALGLSFTVFLGMFLVVPSISPYIQFNLGFPRAHIDLLYMAGGVVTFFTMRISGRLVDLRGAMVTSILGTAIFLTAMIGNYFDVALIPVPVAFVLFMCASSFRMVPANTLMTRVPGPAERARYMSIQSFVQHAATTGGALIATAILAERADHHLVGMPIVAGISIGLALLLPFGLAILEPRVRQLEASRAAAGQGHPAGGLPPAAVVRS